MPVSRHHVALPVERHAQLAQLAERLSCSMSDAVGVMLDTFAQAGVISADIPGLSVKSEGEGVVIDLGSGPRLLPADAAARYGKHVLGAAGFLPPDAAEKHAAAMRKLSGSVLPDSRLGAARQGAGVRLLDAEGASKVVAPSVAATFGKQVIDAARRAGK